MKKSYVAVFVFSFFLLSSTLASANVISSTTDNSSSVSVTNIALWDTTGNKMPGMFITVNFAGGGSSTGTWINGSGASGSGWSLTMNTLTGDYSASTFSPATLWNLSNTSGSAITSIVINGLGQNQTGGDTVFDINPTTPSTPGSQNGMPLTEPSTSDPYNIATYFPTFYSTYYYPAAVADQNIPVNVTYSDEVYVGTNAPVGDLWATMSIDFANGLGDGNSYVWAIDTDNVNAPAVPEPATLLLFGTGLIGIGGIAMRKKN